MPIGRSAPSKFKPKRLVDEGIGDQEDENRGEDARYPAASGELAA